MILQALKEYYDRKSADPESEIAPPGWQWKAIEYVVVLNSDGEPVNVESTVEMVEHTQPNGKVKKEKKIRSFLVPQQVKRSGQASSCLLWDNLNFAIGIDSDGGVSKKCQEYHEDFVRRVHTLDDVQDEGLEALRKCLAMPDRVQKLDALNNPLWETLKATKGWLVFKLAGGDVITNSPAVRKAVSQLTATTDPEATTILCLISGETDQLELKHNVINGVRGCNTTGGNIVCFDKDAFCSHGWERGHNAHIGKNAAFAFLTALNTLLSKNSRNRMQVGDATTVFWCSKNHHFEDEFAFLFTEPEKDDPDRGIDAVRSLFASIENGAYHEETNPTRFYVLGMSPNAARISIRFWIVATVEEMAICIRQHFEDLRITHGPKQPEALPLFRLLISTAAQGKQDNIPPNLAGETMRAILNGTPYPVTLLQAVIRRIRAEHEITYPRAAIIKAYLNRMIRMEQMESLKNEKEMNVTLDLTNVNIGYRLGRLFAVLEKIQSEALPGLNATIRDRFYGAASGTPGSVFSNLMRMKNHHLSKLDSAGRRVYFEQLLGEILSGIPGEFPGHLSLHDQGCFAIGYYHQMQNFFTKKEK